MAAYNNLEARDGIVFDVTVDETDNELIKLDDEEEITKEALAELIHEEMNLAVDASPVHSAPNTEQLHPQQHSPVSSAAKPVVPIRTSSRNVDTHKNTEEEPSADTPDQRLDAEEETTPPLTMDQIQSMYANIIKYKVFQLAGDDLAGRPVIALSMCRLPPRTEIDHQELLAFMKALMDQYVESDYTIVYFHHGLSSKNKPNLRWLLNMYGDLDRKYKKNLKALFLVHSTSFIRMVMKLFYPFISTKFGKKIHQITRLDELAAHIRLDQLDIPEEVWKHDKEIKTQAPSNSIFHTTLEESKTKQFGVSISDLRERSDEPIPVAVKTTIEFITDKALDIEGIFRRSAQANVLEDAVQTFNRGETVEFSLDHTHLAPALLKKFLRDLPEPLLTFALYDKVMESCSLAEEERLSFTDKMLNEDLPEENRVILVHLLQFLQLVIDHSANNRMNSGSLAIVFGPNLLWSRDVAATLVSMSKINSFTKYLIDNVNMIFNESES